MKALTRYIASIGLLLALCLGQLELPRDIPGNQTIHHLGYSLSYNEKHEQAAWVAYELTSIEVNGLVKRKDRFKKDPKVQTESATKKDYKKSGYDRGLLAPAADMKWSKVAMDESFFMSNMSPQSPSFNRGIWKKLESKVRDWATSYGSIYIATGPFLDGKLTAIGTNKVSVPKFYYKVILDFKDPDIKAIGFILPNEKSKNPLQSFAVSINEVEEVSGIDFFYNLPDNLEEAIESELEVGRWKW